MTKKTTLEGKTILHNPRPTTHNNRWLSCKILVSPQSETATMFFLFRDVFLLKAKWLSSLGSELWISFLYPVSPNKCSTPVTYYILSPGIFQRQIKCLENLQEENGLQFSYASYSCLDVSQIGAETYCKWIFIF